MRRCPIFPNSPDCLQSPRDPASSHESCRQCRTSSVPPVPSWSSTTIKTTRPGQVTDQVNGTNSNDCSRPLDSSPRRHTAQAELVEVHSSTLGRKKSRIPTAKQSRVNRSVSDTDLNTDSVDERLETLLQLLGGARQGAVRK